jgi:type I restriction enzyme R subunit
MLKAVLTAEEIDEINNGGDIDIEAVLAAEATERAESTSISYFAFTATPKGKTLELFGREPAGGGNPVPFHVYTMKQAIAEGYILHVLTGYHSFKLAFQIGQIAGGDTEVDQSQASKEVMRWVKLNPQTIAQKAAIIVEHFRDNVAHLLDGHAKAMVVADSRKAAVRYKLAIDKFVHSKGYGYGTLVAFSGSVQDPESGPTDFTEATMNPGVHDLRTAFRATSIESLSWPTSFRPDSISHCCARCTSTESCPASPRCKPCRVSTAPTAPHPGYRRPPH